MHLAAMVAIALLAIACSEKNEQDSIEPEEPTKPNQPTTGDWHTVPISGADISLGDFTLTIPAGTFKAETQVAVTQVKAGQVCGDNEVKAFCEVTSPAMTYKPMTVRMTSDNLGESICLVLLSESYSQSDGQAVNSDVYMETTYDDGAYTATIPELSNGESGSNKETLNFAIGLVKVPTIGKGATRGLFTSDPSLREGDVNGVKWALYVDPSAQKDADVWNAIGDNVHDIVAQAISESMQLFFDMGFTLKKKDGKRVVPIYYKRYYKKFGQFNTWTVDDSMHGGFEASEVSDVYNFIGLAVDKLANDLSQAKFDPSRLKCTIIHELFHYFQYELDSRWQIAKAYGVNMDNRSILYEMASVWSEQFMNNGELNKDFIFERFFGTKLGIGKEKERLPDVPNALMEQGYILGPWLHYLVKEIKRLNLQHKDKHPVYELFDLYSKKWVNESYNAYYILQEWLDSYSNDKLLYNSAAWDDYYLQLWQGKVVKDFHIHELLKYTDVTRKFKNNFTSYSYDDQCYSYGCILRKFSMEDYRGIDLSDKELIVKQESSGIGTYLLWTKKQDNYSKCEIFTQDKMPYSVFKGDSIVIRGKELEALRMHDGTFAHEFYLVTTNTDISLVSAYRSGKPMPSHVTVELRDTVEVKSNSLKVTPSELEVGAEGGTYTFHVDKGNFFYAGLFLAGERSEWDPWVSHDYYDEDHDTFVVRIGSNYSTKGRTYDGLTVWAADRYYEWIDKEHDPYLLTKIPIRQKGNVKRGNVSFVGINSTLNYGENHIKWISESFYSSIDGNDITTVQVGNGIQVTATEYWTSQYGYGDEQIIVTFTIPEIDDYDGYSEIKDFNYQYTFTPDTEKFPDFESKYEHYEVEAASIPFVSNTGNGNGVWEWRDVFESGKSSFKLKDYQKGNDHFPWTPKDNDYISIRISFSEQD